MTKAETRKKHLEKRKKLKRGAVLEKSRLIMEKFLALPAYKVSGTVMFYASFGNEVSTVEAIRKTLGKKKVLLPAVEGRALVAYEIREYDASLTKGAFGMPEPVKSGELKAKLENIDLVVVPGVVFDRVGGRIGFGGGYYDRFLGKLKEVKNEVVFAGFAFEQQLEDRLEIEETDVKMNTVITEKEVYYFNVSS